MKHPQIIVDNMPTPQSIARGCNMPNFMLSILADGTAAPCCVAQEKWGLDNAHDKSLQELWESQRMYEIRGLWKAKDDSIPCGYCSKRADC